MLKLPISTQVNRVIPKNRFLQEANSKIKKEFGQIEKIIWQNNLSPKTINIEADEKIEEIQIFSIHLKEKLIPKNALSHIQKLIPYPILFILQYKDAFAYAIIYEKKLYFKEWNETIDIDFNAPNTQALMQNIVKSFLSLKTNDFAKSLELQKQIEALEKEIKHLKSQIKKEKQFKYKMELNKRLLECQRELERLKNEFNAI